MKIPKSLKLPRKLKKEVKKGFNRNIKSGPPVMSSNPDVVSCSMFQTVNYSGSNTKSFRRLCKYARKEEKRVFEKMVQEEMCKQIYKTYVNNVPVGYLEKFKMPVMQNIVPDFWKEPQRYIIGFDPATGNKDISTVHVSAPDDIITASCIARTMANDLNTSQATIFRVLTDNGIELKDNRHFTDATINRAIELYNAPENSIKYILEQTGIKSEQTLYRYLKDRNVPLRSDIK